MLEEAENLGDSWAIGKFLGVAPWEAAARPASERFKYRLLMQALKEEGKGIS